MSASDSNKKIISGIGWTFAERISAQAVTTIVSIVLARILSPDDYGAVSIIMIFISLCNVFVTSGFGAAIVRQKNIDTEYYDTAFLLSFAISVVLYLILFASAPSISVFFGIPVLKPTIRVLGIRLIVTSLNSIQQAHIQRKMQFKKFFLATIIGTVISCIVGITLAINGFGVWSIIAQYLTNTTVDTVILAFVGGWNPTFRFSVKKAKEMYSFSWKVLCTEIVFTLEGDIRNILVGKYFSAADLAYLDQAKKYPNLFVTNINSSIQKVMLPAFSSIQDNTEEVKSLLRKSIRVCMFALTPLIMGFMAVSETFIHLILTDKWLPMLPYVFIYSFSYLTRPLESACHQVLYALGKSGTVFVIMICINLSDLLVVFFAVFVSKSVMLAAIAILISTLVSIFCFSFSVKKEIGYGISEQISDVFPTLFIGGIMTVCVWFLGKLPCNSVAVLALQIIAGAGIYVLLSIIFKIDSIKYIKLIANKIMSKSQF